MKKLLYMGFAVLVFFGLLYAQQTQYIRESVLLWKMFTRVADGIVYCHSDRSKTTGVVVKTGLTGSWVVTAGHKVDIDFPQASEIDVKVDRNQETKMYTSLEDSIIVPDERGLDLLLFFVPGLKTKYVFEKFRDSFRYEETWIFGFRGGAGKVPGSPGYVTAYFVNRKYAFSSASIWFGCSGSPVLNRKGEVLGLAVRMAEGSTDTLFISGGVVQEFIDKALKGRK